MKDRLRCLSSSIKHQVFWEVRTVVFGALFFISRQQELKEEGKHKQNKQHGVAEITNVGPDVNFLLSDIIIQGERRLLMG